METHSSAQSERRGMSKAYITGYILSVILTIIAFGLVMVAHLPKKILIADILGLAIVQLFVQLYFFLHLGREQKPYWNALVFLFAVGVVVIIVGGSLWIMNNLNYNMTMSPEQMEMYMHDHQGF